MREKIVFSKLEYKYVTFNYNITFKSIIPISYNTITTKIRSSFATNLCDDKSSVGCTLKVRVVVLVNLLVRVVGYPLEPCSTSCYK